MAKNKPEPSIDDTDEVGSPTPPPAAAEPAAETVVDVADPATLKQPAAPAEDEDEPAPVKPK